MAGKMRRDKIIIINLLCCHWKKVILEGAFSFWLVFFHNDITCSLLKVIKIKYTMVTSKSDYGKTSFLLLLFLET